MDYEDVVDVIKSLKTLFNQASALFILISGQEFFTKLISSTTRPTEYTLFPQKIFLQRPQFEDLQKFIKGILNKPTIGEIESRPELKETFYKFQNYVSYASKTDYF